MQLTLLLVGASIAFVIPSSGRANEFVKIGSPITKNMNLYAITSVFDGDPKQYEAWAVGEEVDNNGNPLPSPAGVMLHYTGSFWTRITLTGNIPPLKAVAVSRYLNSLQSNGTNAPIAWTSIGWAVGNGGVIVGLDPYDGSWKIQKKYVKAGYTENRICSIVELSNDAGDTTYSCDNWTTQDLAGVSAVDSNNAIIVGKAGTAMRSYDGVKNFGVGVGMVRHTYWYSWPWDDVSKPTDVNFAAVSFPDSNHGWMAGTDTLGTLPTTDDVGKLYRYTPSVGFQSPGTFGQGLTSIAVLDRSTAPRGEELKSVVWLGGSGGNIYRYDDKTGAVATVYTPSVGTPKINSLALSRRKGGTGQNLIKNGSFNADRKDNGFSNRTPDGWLVYGDYWNPTIPATSSQIIMKPYALLEETSENNVFVGEPMQTSSTNGKLSAVGKYISHSSFFSSDAVFPMQGDVFYSDNNVPNKNFTFTLDAAETDLTPKLLQSKVDDGNSTWFSSHYQLGATLSGFIKVEPGAQYQFRMEHPLGHAELYLENDTANGTSDTTRYPLSTAYPNVTPTASWSVGSCKNAPYSVCSEGVHAGERCDFSDSCLSEGLSVCNGGFNAGKRCTTSTDCPNGSCTANGARCINYEPKCLDASECRWGSCGPKAKYKKCNTDVQCSYSDNSDPSNPRIAYERCEFWGICNGGGNDGNSCKNGDGCNGGTCEKPGANVCKKATPPTTPGVTETDTSSPVVFPVNKGLVSKQCVNADLAFASYVGRSCFTEGPNAAQCGTGGTCQLVTSGWYPIMMRYYEVNTNRCELSQFKAYPCTNDESCTALDTFSQQISLGKCQMGSWCVKGDAVKKGGICTSDNDCWNNPDDALSESCVKQLNTKTTVLDPTKPGACSRDATLSCWKSTDCIVRTETTTTDNGPCVVYSATNDTRKTDGTGSTLKLKWRKQNADNSWPEFTDASIVPSSDLMDSAVNNRTTIVQDVPLTNLAGATFRVKGRYKVEFPNYFDGYSAADPRVRANARASMTIQCKKSSGGFNKCGYDLNVFATDKTKGVTGNGVCSTSGGSCSNNTQCAPGEYCKGDWINFDTMVSKQDLGPQGVRQATNDPSQTMQIVCMADVGARIYCDEISVTQVSSAAVNDFDAVELTAVTEGGGILRHTLDFKDQTVAATEEWVTKTSPLGATSLFSVTSPDPFHTWIAGKKPATDFVSLMSLSTGTISGFAWVGAASTGGGMDPNGYIDFNCSNFGNCNSQPSSFGVSITDPVTEGVCSDDITKTCTTTVTSGCVAPGTANCLGVLSGSAWYGNIDPLEKVDYGPCRDIILGNDSKPYSVCNQGYCANQSSRACSMSGNTGQCKGYCAKNVGFKCTKDSECIVSCKDNPVACKATGWLTFDRSLAGTPPDVPYNDGSLPATAPLATFDLGKDSLEGWGRLQLGSCTNSGLSCFKNADCGAGTCSYVNAPSQSSQGWVKLRGNSAGAGPPVEGIQCGDCTKNVADASGGTCKICTVAASGNTCNSCGSCVLKRCSLPDPNYTACNDVVGECDAIATGSTCKSFGSCSLRPATTCFADADCSPLGGTCTFGSSCTSCPVAQCSQYGVTVNAGDTKQLSGYAWSPDIGWIDFGNTRVGGKQYLQTKFGDIYSGADIGSPTAAQTPGFPGRFVGTAAGICNATFRIVAAGTIVNYCTSAPPSGSLTVDPFFQQSAPLYPMPNTANRYTTQLGALDIEGLQQVVETRNGLKFNKFGDEVRSVDADDDDDNVNLSELTSVLPRTGEGKPYYAILDGKVYRIYDGDLTIDSDYIFQPGNNLKQNGSGTFIINGDLHINANITYEAKANLTNRTQLASVAFIVTGNITVAAGVSNISGVFYSEKNIIVESNTAADRQLVVNGLMVADKFDFRRTYRGQSGVAEPAELIIYDGRIHANTPPGLSTFANGLLSFQESLP